MEKKFLNAENIQVLCKVMAGRIMTDFPTVPIKIFGVPRGGVPVTFMLSKYGNFEIMDKPEHADAIIDDIVDSGKTRDRYINKYNKPFYALINPLNKAPNTWYVFPWESTDVGSMEDIPTRFLQAIGEDPTRDGLKDTPKRIIKSWGELYKGYGMSAKDVLGTQFENDEKYDEMVTLRDIEFYSTCEHHAQPFFGKVHIAYLPMNKVVGISKLARLVEVFARRLQIQERLTQQIANSIMEELKPLGCGVIIEAKHFCMVARGIQKQNSVMVTSALKGKFLLDSSVREEFLKLAGR
jgi:GTP cyclohydrolase I